MKVFVQLLATGGQKEVHVEADQNLSHLKDAIERQCGIQKSQMRIMCQGRNLTDDTKTLLELNIVEGASIVVMVKLNMYNEVAGQTRISGARKDQHGNAIGGKFDLARDGGFKGQKIAVIQLYNKEGFDFKYPQKALEKKGFEIKRWSGYMPPVGELKNELKSCTQLWLISSYDKHLTDDHLNAIKDFFDDGNGIYIWGDNDPFFVDANILGQFLIGATMSGDNPGGKIVRERDRGAQGPGFEQHLVTTGLETLFEGVTIATVSQQPRNVVGDQIKPLVYGSLTDMVTAIYEHDGKRCIIDGGFTRLWCNWDAAGTDRYVTNAGAWLANLERFESFDVGDEGFRDMSPEEVAKLRDAFQLMDRSKSGYIDQADLANVLLSLGQESSEEELKQVIDAASDGGTRISFQSFLALLGQKVQDADIEEEMMEAFKLFDRDNRGSISGKDLQEVMHDLGSTMQTRDAEEMLREADLAGDSKLNYDEFYQIMMGEGKKLSNEQKERADKQAEARHGRGSHATMAHLRAAQRWDALRHNVMRAVRRRRAQQEEKKTGELNVKLTRFRRYHLGLLIFSGIMTGVCVIVPLLLQFSFKYLNQDAQIIRELSNRRWILRITTKR